MKDSSRLFLTALGFIAFIAGVMSCVYLVGTFIQNARAVIG